MVNKNVLDITTIVCYKCGRFPVIITDDGNVAWCALGCGKTLTKGAII